MTTELTGTKPLRVLHVMARMATAGTERQLVGMLRAAHGQLWDAHLCVLFPGYELTAEVAEFMPVTEMPYRRASDPRRPIALRRLARAIDADVVHTSLWGASWITRLSVAGPRRPSVTMSERRVEDFRPEWTRRLDAALRPLTDSWIGNSQDVVDFIRRAHGAPSGRIACIRNGIDGQIFHPRRGPRRPGGLRIGGVGRLVPEKGWETAIAAMPQVAADFPDATLRIAGEGPERTTLENMAAGLPVELIGLLTTPHQVADFLRDLDVFVLPSRFEGLPNVVLEAQACGVPVVATLAPGMAEAVGDPALLVPAGDRDALARAVLRARAGTTLRAAASPQTFDDVARQHLQAFESARLHRGGVR